MPITNHAIVVKINNVDCSDLLLADSLYVRSSISNGNDVAEFALRDASQSFAPADWNTVSVEVNGTAIFGGYIIQREADSIGGGSRKRTVWRFQCKDWSVLLDRVIVNKQYKLTDDSAILSNLFSTYLSGDGFNTSTNVTTVRQDIDINFEEITLREALNGLAARAGANWHIRPNKNLYWYAPASPSNAAFNINTDSPNNSTTFNVLEGTLRRSVDSSQIVNRVRVIGAEAASTALQTDTFAADGSAQRFGPLTRKPHSVWLVDYWLGAGRYIRYASNIGYESNGDKLFADGGGHEIVCNLELRTLDIKHINGSVPDNATNVVVKYYYTQPIEVTRNNTASQAAFGRVFEQSVFDNNLVSVAEATAYADSLLNEYAFGRETINFDVTRHGLLPGRKINVVNSLLGLSADFLIQEVQFRGVAVSQDQFMVVASVQAGKFVQSLIETLKPGYSAGARQVPARSQPGKLSIIATDMGELVAGRAAFTDGGTAKFEWGAPGGATGAVVGLEDINNNAYGAVYIYEGGTVRAKLGRLTDLPNLGTITPTGWGLYTTNGFFSGRVVASTIVGGTIIGNVITGGSISGGHITGGTISGAHLSGGTVSGGLFTGGTINTNTGTIGGWRINGTHLWSIGGSISTSQVVNSANPGIFMSTAGLFGFGTLGMTFGLWTDPARSPWFSSGTINNVVYEVYESAIIRTGSAVFTHGGIQMDNSGLFGVSPIDGYGVLLLENGDRLLLEDGRGIELHGLRFALDTITGRLYAEDAVIEGEIHARNGRFSGQITASQIIGGTISGALISGAQIVGQVISGNNIVGGVISGVPIANTGITNSALDGNLLLGGTITAAQMVGGTVTGALVLGGTVTGGVFTGGTVSGGTVSAAQFNGGTISGALVTGNTVSGGTISGAVVTANQISGGTITGSRITGGTITGVVVTANTISGGTVSASVFTGNSSSGGTISGAAMTANQISGGTISGVLVTGNTITGGTISGGLITGQNISGGTVSGAQVSGGTITGGLISGQTISGGTITGPQLISLAGGSVTMGATYGIGFSTSASHAGGGALVWSVASSDVSALIDIRKVGSDEPELRIRKSRSTTLDNEVTLQRFATQVNYYGGGSIVGGVSVGSASVQIIGALERANAGTGVLGSQFNGWRFLYLDSPNGSTFRVGVDNSGNLVVT